MRSFDDDVREAAGFPTISIDTLRVGERFRSDDRLIRPQDVEAHAFAVDDYDPWFFERGPWDLPVAHPTILANQALFLRHTRYYVPAGLHARMVYEFAAPIRLGVRARTTGEVVDTYWRRNKPYMVTAYETADEHGDVLVRGRFVQMLFAGDTAPPSGAAPRPEPEPTAVDPTIESARGRVGAIVSGDRWVGAPITITQRKIDIFSGVRPGSIHSDIEWARAKGFDRTIAQGMMSTGHASALLCRHLGKGFVVGGTLDCRFLRPVLAGDNLTTEATVVGFSRNDDDQVRAHVAVATSNQKGEQTLAGSATAIVDRQVGPEEK